MSPAFSNPRPNPPIPANKDAEVCIKRNSPALFRSAAALLSAVFSQVSARLWFRMPIQQYIPTLKVVILAHAFHPAACSVLSWHSNRLCCFWDGGCRCLSYSYVRAKNTRAQTRSFSTLAKQHLDFRASLFYATGIGSPTCEAFDATAISGCVSLPVIRRMISDRCSFVKTSTFLDPMAEGVSRG